MTGAPPPRDSVLDALGYAIRVFTKLEFLWAPFILYVILLLPLLATPGLAGAPPSLTTQAEAEAYLRDFVPVFVGSVVLGIVLGPLLSAVMYRLGQQYIDGEPAVPFGPGVVGLAWRFFLQTIALVLIVSILTFAFVLLFVLLQGTIGIGPAVVIFFLGVFAASIYFILRLGLAPVMLLWGAGPIESLGKSWELTRGHLGQVFRWFFVSGLVIGLLGGLVSAAIGGFFAGALGQVAVGQYLGTLLIAPAGLVTIIVQVLLARLLMSPPQAPAPPPALPEWMNQTTPPAESPPTPPTPPTPASDGS